jgi:hypothetical protein
MIREKKFRIKNIKKEDKTEKPPISERLLNYYPISLSM